MKQYQIPHTDIATGRIGLGCMNMTPAFGDAGSSAEVRQRLCELIETALDAGINLFDHADIYAAGAVEQVFGHALGNLRGRRETMVIQSKCGIRIAQRDGGPMGYFDFSYEHILWSVDQSLRRLQTDYLDILLLHRPDPLMEPEEVARAFENLRETGKVRHFGVSNQSVSQLQLLHKYLTVPLVINQLEFSLYHSDLVSNGVEVNRQQHTYANTSGLLDYCRLHNILIQAWAPLGQPASYSGNRTSDRNQAAEQLLERMAGAHNVGWRALALAWILRHPAGIQPIIGTNSPGHLRANCAADAIELNRADWTELLVAARGQPMP